MKVCNCALPSMYQNNDYNPCEHCSNNINNKIKNENFFKEIKTIKFGNRT